MAGFLKANYQLAGASDFTGFLSAVNNDYYTTIIQINGMVDDEHLGLIKELLGADISNTGLWILDNGCVKYSCLESEYLWHDIIQNKDYVAEKSPEETKINVGGREYITDVNCITVSVYDNLLDKLVCVSQFDIVNGYSKTF